MRDRGYLLAFSCCDKDDDKKQLREDRFCFSLLFTNTHERVPGQELKAGIWREGLKQKSWRNAAYWLLPQGLQNSQFYYNPRTTYQRLVCLQWSRTPKSIIYFKKRPHRISYSPSGGGNFIS